MNHISLFSGQGGFDLAAQWMGWNNIAHCEIDPFCQRILKYYWPHATTHTDIRTTDFTVYGGQCDILTMGVPCQPYSTAGKRLGKEDERHLWPEGFRAVREVSPRWVLFENVRGLVNWNGGLVFDEVQADLESAGYEVTPFLLPAASVNAPHRRDRIWIVAYASPLRERSGTYGTGGDNQGGKQLEGAESGCDSYDNGEGGIVAHSAGIRCQRDIPSGQTLQRSEQTRRETGSGDTEVATNSPIITQREQANKVDTIAESGETRSISGSSYEPGYWRDFPTQPPLRSGNDGFSEQLDGITFSKWCEKSIAAAGNAVVPQVVYQIFQAIQQYECSG